MIFFNVFWLELQERTLSPDFDFSFLLFDHLPELLEGLNVKLELVDVGVLSRGIIQINLHIIDILHFFLQRDQFGINRHDLLVVLVFKTFVCVLSELFKFALDLI